MIMTVLLLFLMARQLTGDSAHEWLGAGMLILWIVHHILNRSWYSHGTYMTLTAYGESAKAALTLSEDRIKELEALWSTTDENSDIYKVNQSSGTRTEVSEETAEILQFALDILPNHYCINNAFQKMPCKPLLL